MIIIYQINSLADFTDLRRRTTNSKTTLTTNCLSLRDNAACCIPLRDLRNLRENIHARVLNLYCSNEPPMYPADLADLRRQTTITSRFEYNLMLYYSLV